MEKHPDSYIAVSRRVEFEPGTFETYVTVLLGENIRLTAELLEKNPDGDSWELITKTLDEE